MYFMWQGVPLSSITEQSQAAPPAVHCHQPGFIKQNNVQEAPRPQILTGKKPSGCWELLGKGWQIKLAVPPSPHCYDVVILGVLCNPISGRTL